MGQEKVKRKTEDKKINNNNKFGEREIREFILIMVVLIEVKRFLIEKFVK